MVESKQGREFPRIPRIWVIRRKEVERLADPHARVDPPALQHATHLVDHGPVLSHWIDSQHTDESTRWREIPLKATERGGLACTIGTEEGDNFAWLDADRDLVHCHRVAERHHEVTGNDGCALNRRRRFGGHVLRRYR